MTDPGLYLGAGVRCSERKDGGWGYVIPPREKEVRGTYPRNLKNTCAEWVLSNLNT